MKTNWQILTAIIFLVPIFGCDTEAELDTNLRGFPLESHWDSVRCVEGTGLCYGHASGTDGDMWARVYSSCQLEQIVSAGFFEPASEDIGWSDSTCAPGNRPITTPIVQCYQIAGTTETVCFGGDDGWLAEIRPSCESAGFVQKDYFGDGSCTTTLGSYGFDIARSHPDKPNRARAFLGPDAVDVYPSCFINSFDLVEADANECS